MGENIVVLATYPFSRAEIIKECLMAEGIDCSLANVNAISAVPGGAVRVLVLEKDFTQAAAILIDLEEEFAEEKVEDAEIAEDIDKILCPVNFTESSFESAIYALNIAAKLGAELYIVHSYSFPIVQSVDFMDTNAIAFTEDKTISEIQNDAQDGLVQFIERLKEYAIEKGLNTVNLKSFLLNGHPADEILRFVDDHQVKSIVLSSSTDAESTNLSFIAEHIIANADIPVLAIPIGAKFEGIARVHVLYMAANDDVDFFSMKKLLTLLYPFDVVVHCLSFIANDTIAELQIKKWKLHFEKRYAGFGFHCMNITNPSNILDTLRVVIKENNIDIVSMVAQQKSFFQEIIHPGLTKKYVFELKNPILVFHN